MRSLPFNLSTLAALTALSVATLSAPARSEVATTAPEKDAAVEQPKLRWELRPYAMLPLQSSGTVQVGDDTADVNANLRDLTEHLQMAAALHVELWYSRFGAILDGSYVHLGQSRTLPRDSRWTSAPERSCSANGLW